MALLQVSSQQASKASKQNHVSFQNDEISIPSDTVSYELSSVAEDEEEDSSIMNADEFGFVRGGAAANRGGSCGNFDDDESIIKKTSAVFAALQEHVEKIQEGSLFFALNPPSLRLPPTLSSSDLIIGDVIEEGPFGTVRNVRLADEWYELLDNENNSHDEEMEEDFGAIFGSKPWGDSTLAMRIQQYNNKNIIGRQESKKVKRKCCDSASDEEEHTTNTFDSSVSSFNTTLTPQRDHHPTETHARSRSILKPEQLRNRYALKKVRENLGNGGDKFISAAVSLCNEAMLLCRMSHPNIVKLQGIISAAGHPGCFGGDSMIIMERFDKTLKDQVEEWKRRSSWSCWLLSLCSFRYDKKSSDSRSAYQKQYLSRKVSMKQRLNAANGVAQALKYLHSQNIIARDIKPSNIGIDKQGNACLFDFGMAKELKEQDLYCRDSYRCTMCIGTLRWMAPEVFLSGRYGLKADVYSFGLLLWHLISLRMPYRNIGPDSHCEEVFFNGIRPRIPASIESKGLGRLIENCWKDDPRDRPSISIAYRTLAANL